MPEAFPDFDKKPPVPAPAPAPPDGTAEEADPQERAGAPGRDATVGSEPRGTPVAPAEAAATRSADASEERPPPADAPAARRIASDPPTAKGAEKGERAAASPDDPYANPYHSGVRGSAAGRTVREPAASDADSDDPGVDELDGTGVAGLMRRWAVARRADAAGRGTVLGLADHVEAVETRIGGVLGKPLRDRGMDGLARRVERNPLAAIAGAVLAGWIVNRMLD